VYLGVKTYNEIVSCPLDKVLYIVRKHNIGKIIRLVVVVLRMLVAE